jgi:hypothetical protein
MPPIDLDAIVAAVVADDEAVRFLRRVQALEVHNHRGSLSYQVTVGLDRYPVVVVRDDGSELPPEWLTPPAPIDPMTGEVQPQVTGKEIMAFRKLLEQHARTYLDIRYGAADTLIAGLAGSGTGSNGLQAGLRFRSIAGDLRDPNVLKRPA